MAKNFSYPSTRKTTLGARLKIAALPLNIRSPIIYTITTTRSFNSNTDNGIIYLKSNADVYFSPELFLNLNGVFIQIAEGVLVNTLETAVSIIDLPLNQTIPLNSSTTTLALLLVNGCKSCNITSEIQIIDTSNISHGIEKEERQSFNSKKISIEVVEIFGDAGGNSLIELCENSTYRNYEFWFNQSFADGSYKEGAVIITSYTPNTNNQSIRNFRIEGRIQPKTYRYFNT